MRAPSRARLVLSRAPSTPYPTPVFSPPPPGPSAILASKQGKRWQGRADSRRAGRRDCSV